MRRTLRRQDLIDLVRAGEFEEVNGAGEFGPDEQDLEVFWPPYQSEVREEEVA